jgi:hypothetical protein
MGSLSSGSPHVTSQARREAQVTSVLLARATTWPVAACLPKAAKRTTGPKVLVYRPAAGPPGQLRPARHIPGPETLPDQNRGRRRRKAAGFRARRRVPPGSGTRAWPRHSTPPSAVRTCQAGPWPGRSGRPARRGGGRGSRVAAGAGVVAVSRVPMVSGYHAVPEVPFDEQRRRDAQHERGRPGPGARTTRRGWRRRGVPGLPGRHAGHRAGRDGTA